MADDEPNGQKQVTVRRRQTVLDHLTERFLRARRSSTHRLTGQVNKKKRNGRDGVSGAEPQLDGSAISSNAGKGRTPWHHMRATEQTIDSKAVRCQRGWVKVKREEQQPFVKQ